MNPVLSTTGKWRRTAGGKLRLGCCCECTPDYLRLEFSGITLTTGCNTPCYNVYSGSMDFTIVLPQVAGSGGFGVPPGCWEDYTGEEGSASCATSTPPSPPWTPAKVGIHAWPGWPTGWVYFGYRHFTGACTYPGDPTFYVNYYFYKTFTIVPRMLCSSFELSNGQLVNRHCAASGLSTMLGYGGTVTVTPL